MTAAGAASSRTSALNRVLVLIISRKDANVSSQDL